MIAARTPEPATDPPRPEFAAVYRAHVGFVWRTLRRFGVAEAEIEDAAHEVFMVVHRRLPEFDGRAAVTTWLHVIARGVASNRRRGAERRERRDADPPPPASTLDPGEQLERSRAAAAVERFLASLPADQRQVFELFEIEGLRAAEIGEALVLNINTVYTRLRAARLRFAEFVAQHHARERGAAHG
jgi:RNA polymerase sigma-70 factor (ECF subfamily)